jgi:hypothetical protein
MSLGCKTLDEQDRFLLQTHWITITVDSNIVEAERAIYWPNLVVRRSFL